MKPTLTIGNAVVYHGSNLDVLPTLADNSVDSIVCDPPYELGFMGKKWDSSGIAYSVELWSECLRVLKPGGHLLAFGGSRTWHRLAVAIEDAGFEVRDSIAWLYGSGFPKSMDISKAIDKSDAGEARRKRDLQFVEWMRNSNLTATKCDEILKQANRISPTSSHSIHYFNDGQPAVAVADIFDILRPYLPEVPDYIEQMITKRTIESENFKKREVIGKHNAPAKSIFTQAQTELSQDVDITAPATEEAKRWAGWGTALKPAFEPVVVARKPLIGTVAANVLEWGTGGLNIDGSRIGTDGGGTHCDNRDDAGNCQGHSGTGKFSDTVHARQLDKTQGRWPANIILDEYTAGLLDEQQEEVSRFFYVAKASKKDRNEGLDELEAQRHADRITADGVGGDNPRNRTNHAKQNFHPTVKPTAIMEYLIKLVTPPNGIVLDPFIGSGSTGKAALLNGYQFIGIELTEEYLPIIEGRLTHAMQTYEVQAIAKEEEESETLF